MIIIHVPAGLVAFAGPNLVRLVERIVHIVGPVQRWKLPIRMTIHPLPATLTQHFRRSADQGTGPIAALKREEQKVRRGVVATGVPVLVLVSATPASVQSHSRKITATPASAATVVPALSLGRIIATAAVTRATSIAV